MAGSSPTAGLQETPAGQLVPAVTNVLVPENSGGHGICPERKGDAARRFLMPGNNPREPGRLPGIMVVTGWCSCRPIRLWERDGHGPCPGCGSSAGHPQRQQHGPPATDPEAVPAGPAQATPLPRAAGQDGTSREETPPRQKSRPDGHLRYRLAPTSPESLHPPRFPLQSLFPF